MRRPLGVMALLLWAAPALGQEPLVVAVPNDYAPFAFADGQGVARGILPEIWELWSRQSGRSVDVVPLPWPEILAWISDGRADVVDPIRITRTNQDHFAFSPPHDTVDIVLFYHADVLGVVDAATTHDLNVGVLEGDTCGEVLLAAGSDELSTYDTPAALFRDVVAGNARVFCFPVDFGRHLLTDAGISAAFRQTAPIATVNQHWAVRAGDDATFTLIAEGFAAIDPAATAEVRARWIPSATAEDRAFWMQPGIWTPILAAVLAALTIFAVMAIRIRQANRHRHQTAIALQERKREFAALKQIIEATTDMSLPLEELVSRTADILPSGFAYPDDAAARIAIDECVVDRLGAQGVAARMDVPITANGEQRGTISVIYRSAHPDVDEGPFWTNERSLVEIVSQRLASIAVRKKSDALLLYTEERYRAIFQNAATPTAIDEGPTFIDMNEAALRSFGVTDPADMIGKSPAEFSPEFQPDGRRSADVIPRVVERLGKDGTVRFDWTFRKADGTNFLAEVTLSSVVFAGQRITLSTWNDVTELRKAQATLARYNETLSEDVARRTADLAKLNSEFAAILTTATLGIALVRHMKVIRSNPALARMFRTSEESINGQSLGEWCHDTETWAACGVRADKALWSGETFVVDHELRRRDGSTFWAQLSARAVDYRQPEFGSVWVVEDISVERAAQAEMHKARLMAEEAAAVKAQFLANMSHEIRTPMNAIIGFAELLRDTELAPRQRGYLDRISAAGENLLGIINDILDFSKVEAGKIRIEDTDLSLRNLVRGAVEMILSRATEKRLDVIVDIAPTVPDSLRGDPLRIGQVLLNLLSNAVKFTEKGDVVIRVDGRPQDDGSWTMTFKVSDTGIGMTPDQMSRLFESFSQADASTTRVFGGTGLGLVISKSLAELMGGRISVESAPAQGTTFTVELPLSPASAPQPIGPTLSEHAFLLVDSHDLQVTVLTRSLQACGAEVDRVATLAEARQLVTSRTEAAPGWTAVLVASPPVASMADLAAIAERERILLMTYPGAESLIDPDIRRIAADVILRPVDAEIVLQWLHPQANVDARSAPASQPRTPVRTLTGRNVLLVEDNPFNQELAAEFLDQMGATMTLVCNGAEAVEAVSRQTFDIVLMDLQMPVMGGIDATKAIRALKGPAANVPIIAMTASVQPDDEANAYKAGMNDLITKPCPPQVLEAAILRLVGATDTTLPDPSDTHHHSAGNVLTLPDDLVALSHLDTARGLALADRSLPLYRKLILRFVTGFEGFETSFLAARTSSDPQAAERMAHTLKSSAAQIGATALSQAAGLLELAERKGGAENGSDLLNDVVARLNEVLSDLKSLSVTSASTESTAARPAPGPTHMTFDAAVARMTDLLERGEFASVTLLETLGSALQPGFAPEEWTAFNRAMQAFDLPSALEHLRQATAHGNKGKT